MGYNDELSLLTNVYRMATIRINVIKKNNWQNVRCVAKVVWLHRTRGSFGLYKPNNKRLMILDILYEAKKL
jgi:hypothetical protein